MNDYLLSYITPAGIEYPLNDNVHTRVLEDGLQGFGVIRVEPSSERRPYHQGVSLLGGPYTPAREMNLALDMTHNSLAEWVTFNRTLSRNVSSYQGADNLGVLRVTMPDDVIRSIACWMVEWSEGNRNGPANATVVAAFWAPLPWFYDPALQSETFMLTSPAGITYPAAYDVATGIPYGTADIDVDLVPNNLGDVETWPTMRVYGPGTNLSIENETTGKILATTQAMAALDYILIDMEAATIVWYDQSAGTTTSIMQTLTDASEFFPLRRGQNILNITMASASTGNVLVTWYNYYQSV